MYKKILFPVDLAHPNSCKSSVKTLSELAKAFDAEVHILTVIPDSGMAIVSQYFNKNATNEILEQAKQNLHKFVQDNFSSEIRIVNAIVGTGNIYESIISTAKKIGNDLIIMSANRPELKDYLLGPNSARVVRHSDISVLVVRDKK